MPDVDLVTVYNVPIAEVGDDWHASTGDVSITEGDLRSAVAALDDQAVRTPRLKLGHLDPRFTPDGDKGIFDGTPALGKFINLRLDESNQTILGDIAGVPRWLSKIMPTAYGSRSLEGYWGVTTSTGRTHDFVITAVALLGVVPPAIETLEDLPVLYSTEGPNGVEMVEGKKVAASKEVRMPEKIAASVSYEAVRRSFYEDFAQDERYWWWIHATFVDPPSVIAEDDAGGCWYVPFSTSGDEVTWGEPQEVKIQYADKGTGKVVAKSGENIPSGTPVKIFASAQMSRPEERRKESPVMPGVSLELLRKTTGLTVEQLPDGSSEEQINAALTAHAEASAQLPPEPPKKDEPVAAPPVAVAPVEDPAVPVAASKGGVVHDNPDHVYVDKQVWENTQRGAQVALKIAEERKQEENDKIIDKAILAGKIPPSRREKYITLLNGPDREGTVEWIGQLASSTVPLYEIGTSLSGEDSQDEVYPQDWLTDDEAEKIAASAVPTGQRVKSSSRIVVEH